MSRKQALTELIAKVEAGSEDTPDFSALVSRPLMQCKAGEAYRGSLDAAKALHEAVLPKNCFWWVEHRPDGQFQSGVAVGNLGRCFQAFADTPARAWLLAILRALHAQEGGEA